MGKQDDLDCSKSAAGRKKKIKTAPNNIKSAMSNSKSFGSNMKKPGHGSIKSVTSSQKVIKKKDPLAASSRSSKVKKQTRSKQHRSSGQKTPQENSEHEENIFKPAKQGSSRRNHNSNRKDGLDGSVKNIDSSKKKIIKKKILMKRPGDKKAESDTNIAARSPHQESNLEDESHKKKEASLKLAASKKDKAQRETKKDEPKKIEDVKKEEKIKPKIEDNQPQPAPNPKEPVNPDPNQGDENEATDAEASQPYAEREKVFFRTGSHITLGKQVFAVVEGSIMGDYGVCLIKEDNKNEKLTLKYEGMDSKIKRIRIECQLLLTAEKMKKRRITKFVQKGSLDNVRLRYLVCAALGPTIQDILRKLNISSFPVRAALKLGVETLDAINELHEIGFLHRDIKPSCFAFGLEPSQSQRLFMTNFGLAKKYRVGEKNKQTAEQRKTVPFMGTVRYASRATHKRADRSRCDDIESWLYMVVEFVESKALTWRKMTNRDEILTEKAKFMTKEGFKEILDKHKVPEEYSLLVTYAKTMEFSTRPGYTFLKSPFLDVMEKLKVSPKDPYNFDHGDDSKEKDKPEPVVALHSLQLCTESTQADDDD